MYTGNDIWLAKDDISLRANQTKVPKQLDSGLIQPLTVTNAQESRDLLTLVEKLAQWETPCVAN